MGTIFCSLTYLVAVKDNGAPFISTIHVGHVHYSWHMSSNDSPLGHGTR